MADHEHYHPSRLRYILLYLLIIIIASFSFFIYKNEYSLYIGLSLIFILLLIIEIKVHSNHLIIKDYELTNQSGILSKKRIVINYSNITDFTIDQSFIQRIFGIGNIHIYAGRDIRETIIKNFSNINKIHESILKKIRISQKQNIKG